MSAYSGIKGTSVIYSQIHSVGKSKAKIPGISLYNNFFFDNNIITAWRANGIGDGVEISSKLWMGKGNTVSLSIYQVYNEGEVETVLQENANLWQQQTLSHVGSWLGIEN